MAKCSKCDYKFATQEKCSNCGSEDPVSVSHELYKNIQQITNCCSYYFIYFII